jgi:hypothetical protein
MKPIERSVAMEWLCKQVRCYVVAQLLSCDSSNRHAHNKRRAVGSCVFCVVHAEFIIKDKVESLQSDSQLRVAEAGDSLGTQRKGIVCHWKLLLSSTVKTVTEH